jgi:hypothetical protein
MDCVSKSSVSIGIDMEMAVYCHDATIQVRACFSAAANQAPRCTTSPPNLMRNRRTDVKSGIVCYSGPVFTNLDLYSHVSPNASTRSTKHALQCSGEVCLASAHTKPPPVSLGWYCLHFLSVIFNSRYCDFLGIHFLQLSQ